MHSSQGKGHSRKFQDIRQPSRLGEIPEPEKFNQYDRIPEVVEFRPTHSEEYRPRPRLWKKVLSISLLASLILFVSLGVGLYQIKQKLSTSAALGLEHFQTAVSSLRDLDLKKAHEKAVNGETQIQELGKQLSPFQSILASNLGGGIMPFFKDVASVYQDFEGVSNLALKTIENAANLQVLWPKALKGESSDEILNRLTEIQTNIQLISEASTRLADQGSRYQEYLPFDPVSYLSFQLDLARAKSLLDTLLPWFKNPGERHLAVFLQNPSEMRPGGGFIGSYAEVILKGASVSSLEVRDIAYADREFERTIVPPQPLQALVKRWRAADANWFFDFPTSAKKVLDFMESSNSYKERTFKFDGAIGLSARAVEDLLEITGPLELPSGSKITKDNFITEIQKDVQAGHDSQSDEAKKILSELWPLILDKLSNTKAEDQEKLWTMVQNWVNKKDFMVYMRDSNLQRFLSAVNATGEVSNFASDYSGDYLAVVNANIGGGKTDIYMKQTIHLQSQLTPEGEINNHLIITREHQGKENMSWWYQTTNQNYLQVLTPPTVQLSYANGGIARTIKPQIKYDAEGFEKDPDLGLIENSKWEHVGFPMITSFREFGKNSFTTWTKTVRGEKTEVIFDYSRKISSAPKSGDKHEFIFEKQAGATGEYIFEFTAPVGFRFKENSLPVYEYKTNEPPARLVLDLTLEQI